MKLNVAGVSISLGSALVGYTALRIFSIHTARQRAFEQAQVSMADPNDPTKPYSVKLSDSAIAALNPGTFIKFWEIPADLGLVQGSTVQFAGVTPCVSCYSRMPLLRG